MHSAFPHPETLRRFPKTHPRVSLHVSATCQCFISELRLRASSQSLVSGYCFSDTEALQKKDTPLGAGRRNPTYPANSSRQSPPSNLSRYYPTDRPVGKEKQTPLQTVILSAARTSRSEAPAKSKDPIPSAPSKNSARHSPRALCRTGHDITPPSQQRGRARLQPCRKNPPQNRLQPPRPTADCLTTLSVLFPALDPPGTKVVYPHLPDTDR
jgi:hypothetical protein